MEGEVTVLSHFRGILTEGSILLFRLQFVLSMGCTPMKVGLRCIIKVDGEQSAMTTGTSMTLTSYASSLDTPQRVKPGGVRTSVQDLGRFFWTKSAVQVRNHILVSADTTAGSSTTVTTAKMLE